MQHKLKVYISCSLPIKTMGKLNKYYDCYVNSKEGNINDLIRESGIAFDAVVSLLSDKISKDFSNLFPWLKSFPTMLLVSIISI